VHDFGAHFVETWNVPGMVNAMYFFVGVLSTQFQNEVYCYAFHRTFRSFNPRANKSTDCERAVVMRSNLDRLRYEAGVKSPGFFAS
jgi:hypothetical protein